MTWRQKMCAQYLELGKLRGTLKCWNCNPWLATKVFAELRNKKLEPIPQPKPSLIGELQSSHEATGVDWWNSNQQTCVRHRLFFVCKMWGAASWQRVLWLCMFKSFWKGTATGRTVAVLHHPAAPARGETPLGSTTLKAWLTDRHMKQKRLPRDLRGTTRTRWKWSNNKVLAFFLVQFSAQAFYFFG